MDAIFPETKYFPLFNIRLIFRKYNNKWKYEGWYHPRLDRVLD